MLAAACSGDSSAPAIFCASSKRPDSPTTSARFWRTRLSALGEAIACRSSFSACFKSPVITNDMA